MDQKVKSREFANVAKNQLSDQLIEKIIFIEKLNFHIRFASGSQHRDGSSASFNDRQSRVTFIDNRARSAGHPKRNQIMLIDYNVIFYTNSLTYCLK